MVDRLGMRCVVVCSLHRSQACLLGFGRKKGIETTQEFGTVIHKEVSLLPNSQVVKSFVFFESDAASNFSPTEMSPLSSSFIFSLIPSSSLSLIDYSY